VHRVYKIFSKPFEMAERGGASLKNGVLEIVGKGGEVIRKIVTDPKIEERLLLLRQRGQAVLELNVYKMERLEFEARG